MENKEREIEYAIVKDGIIENLIICANDEVAEEFGAVRSYYGARLGDPYDPPPIFSSQDISEIIYHLLK